MPLSLILLCQEWTHALGVCNVFHQRAKHELDKIRLRAVRNTTFLGSASEGVVQACDELLAVLETLLPVLVKEIADLTCVGVGSLNEFVLEDSALELNRILHVLDDRF